MTTVLQARSKGFVNTPAVERLTQRAFRYLQSGFSVHLRGPAGTGKTTLALHLADLLGRPMMLVFGDDEFKTSDLIGDKNGYTRKKVVDNFIHSVVKLEDEMRHNWVDSRLTMACREGFTLVYDEFNRSRPEVNNVLLSALEEKLLALPPTAKGSEYVRVSSHFRGIFTSNPEEYSGVHSTQDALMDRLITINIPEPDELTQQAIVMAKTGLARPQASTIVRLVKTFRRQAKAQKSSGLRACLMLAKVCQDHTIEVAASNDEFREICADILFSRIDLSLGEAVPILNRCLDYVTPDSGVSVAISPRPSGQESNPEMLANSNGSRSSQQNDFQHNNPQHDNPQHNGPLSPNSQGNNNQGNPPPATVTTPSAQNESLSPNGTHGNGANGNGANYTGQDLKGEDLKGQGGSGNGARRGRGKGNGSHSNGTSSNGTSSNGSHAPISPADAPEQAIVNYLQTTQGANLSEIESALGINRVQAVDSLRSLTEKGILVVQRDDSKAKDTGRTVYHISTP